MATPQLQDPTTMFDTAIRPRRSQVLLFTFCILIFVGSSACRRDMQDQPKYKPLSPIESIGSITDGRASRPVVEGTVARGHLKDDVEFFTGKTGHEQSAATLAPQTDRPATAQQPPARQTSGQGTQSYQGFVSEFPIAVNREMLDRGQERYNIYCSVCHGRSGTGDGMVTRRGFKRPPSYHDERLRNAPVGYFFDVITNGFGAMPDYSAQISPRDRWAIISYVRALQLSRQGSLADVPPGERENLKQGRREEQK
jgi:mono/diheme cytochrome c family protein